MSYSLIHAGIKALHTGSSIKFKPKKETMELISDLRSRADFEHLRELNPSLFEPSGINTIANDIAQNGCFEPITEARIAPYELSIGESWRESLAYRGVPSRSRGVMLCIEHFRHRFQNGLPSIYSAEAVTPFALRMRSIFPRYLGSEYTSSPEIAKDLYPIPNEDLQRLSFSNASFELIVTNEVLEHVPDIDQALAEMYRVLKPDGAHLGTVPFLYLDDKGEKRATISDQGEIVHLLEPQYHGDPMSAQGVLVFELPSWDILERAREVGFRDAYLRYIVSSRYGIVAEHCGGVLALCLEK